MIELQQQHRTNRQLNYYKGFRTSGIYDSREMLIHVYTFHCRKSILNELQNAHLGTSKMENLARNQIWIVISSTSPKIFYLINPQQLFASYGAEKN